MSQTTRRTDKKGRVTLFNDFADSLVILERVGDDEVRVRKAKAVPRRYTLAQLVKGITPENVHPETQTGPPVGEEEW